MNAVAGGGTLVAFPALLFAGVPPIIANATTSLGVWPSTITSGWVYRKYIKTPRRTVVFLIVVSLAGGFVGAWLLLHTPERLFERFVPLLLIFAATLFTVSGRLRRMAERMSIPAGGLMVLAGIGQFGIAIFGGYFGAAMGVLMLSLFAFTLGGNIHSINGVRTFCGTAIKATAIIVFIFGHQIDWRFAAVMATGTIVGSTVGALGMRRLDPAIARRIVLVIAWGMTLAYVAKIGL